MWGDWCHMKDEPEDGDLEFNDGTDTCTMLSGSVLTVYRDADFTVVNEVESAAKVDEVVANAVCCLAYDPESEDRFDLELSYACEELVSRNVTYVLSDGLDGKVCAATTDLA